MLGGIPIDRSGNFVPALNRCLRCLQSEESIVLIHPEGTRTRNGQLGAFKAGAAQLAKDAGVSMIPVCMKGGYVIYPSTSKLPKLFDWKNRSRYRIKIVFGTAIHGESLNAVQMTEQVRKQIVEMQAIVN